MTKLHLFLCAAVAGLGCSAAGGSESSAGMKDAGFSSWGGSAGSYSAGGSSGSAGVIRGDAAAAADVSLPPEIEQKLDFLAPQAGARFVYVANPSRNSVSVIDSTNLSVAEVQPGDSPTYVATMPGQDVALVINAGSHTLAILRGSGIDKRDIPVVARANSIAIAPDGQHAVIWFDASKLGNTGTGGVSGTPLGSTQEVSVVDVGASKSTTMTVGYNPSAVVFSSDTNPASAAAFVVTDDGISELRFAAITKSGIAPFTPLGNGTVVSLADAGTAPTGEAVDGGAGSIDGGGVLDGGVSTDTGRDASPDLSGKPSTGIGKVVDVSVTSAGTYAVARRDGSAELLLVNLKTHTVSSLVLSSQVTDLDLLPSGAQAFAVLRNESKLVKIQIPESFTAGVPVTSQALGDVLVGSVTLSPKGTFAVLYTTAVPSQTLDILDSATAQLRTVVLRQTIRAVAISPDESSALVLHSESSSNGTKSYGYTMVRLQDGFAKLQTTPAQPSMISITPDSAAAFVILRDDAASIRIAERIFLDSFVTTDFPLGSPPNSISALSATSHKVFVGQVHPEGRISFIDWLNETGSVETVTGFALNGRIQQ